MNISKCLTNVLYPGFAEVYLYVSIHTEQCLKPKGKLGVSVHVIEQRCYKVDLFALKSDICVTCLILIYILLYFILTINFVPFYAK